jgi:hypothetical protein
MNAGEEYEQVKLGGAQVELPLVEAWLKWSAEEPKLEYEKFGNSEDLDFVMEHVEGEGGITWWRNLC